MTVSDHRTEWTESEYREYLEAERRLFAWCLVRYGGFDTDDARVAAEVRYPYEPPDAPHRGLIFHEEAWDWAMRHLFGHDYRDTHPQFADQSDEYVVEASR